MCKDSLLDDIEFSTLNWVEDSIFDDDLDDIFAAKYRPSLMDYGPEYDVSEFDDLCFAVNCLLASTSEPAPESVSPSTAPELKPLCVSHKYSFLRPNESLPAIIASNLDRDQEDKLIAFCFEGIRKL